MTIAAAFVCTDGIILCADSQNSDEQAKYQHDKIFSLGDSLLVTGSGSTAYIRMAFDKLRDAFKSSAPVNPADARGKVEEVMKDLYSEHLFKFWQPSDPYRPDLGLIVGARCTNDKSALIKTSLTAAYLSEKYEVVGTGQPMLEYWASYLYRDNLDMDAMSYLCFFMLSEVKKHSEYCGGWSLVMRLPSAKDYKLPRVQRLLADSGIMANFPESMTRILSTIANFSVTDEWVQEKLQELSRNVWQFENRKDR